LSNFDALAFMFVLSVLYVLESGAWVRRDALLLARAGADFFLKRSGGLFSTDRGWLAILSPLPPLESGFVVQSLPFSWSENGISTHAIPTLHPHGRQAEERRVFRWEDLKKIETDGKKVVLGKSTIAVGHARMADAVARLLTAVRDAEPESRRDRIDALFAEALDEDEAKRRLNLFEEKSILPRLLANLIFFQVFFLLPFLYFTGLFYPRWYLFVGELALLMWTNAFAYFFAHKQLFAQSRLERISTFVSLLMWPPAAIRSHDKLGRHLFMGLHPVGVVGALVPTEVKREFLGTLLRDARHPLGLESAFDDADADADAEGGDRALADIEANFATRHQALLLESASAMGLQEKEALAPPEKEGDLLQSYCPRCMLQYRVQGGECSDCAGVSLVAFSEKGKRKKKGGKKA
jgi:hypothetical protein